MNTEEHSALTQPEEEVVVPTGLKVGDTDIAYFSKEQLIDVIKKQEEQNKRFVELHNIQVDAYVDLIKRLK